MRKHRSARLLTTLVALLAVAWGVPARGAASSEAGWGCFASGSEAGWTLLAAHNPESPYSPLVKESPGVIVGWNVRVGQGLGPLAQQLGVFRPTGSADEYTKVAESAVETFGEGTEGFPTRIPVQAGDVLGLHGPVETFYCMGGAPSPLFEGGIGLGETKIFKPKVAPQPPVSAVVEPDVDGDGYGDSRQDRCPESAVFQTDCPLVALSIGDVAVKRRAILIEVGNNTEATVEARGEVRWRKVRVGLNAAAKAVTPGATVVLRVPLRKSVLRELDRRLPRQALRARIDVRGTNLVPYVGTHELRIRLPGRAPGRSGAAGTLRE